MYFTIIRHKNLIPSKVEKLTVRSEHIPPIFSPLLSHTLHYRYLFVLDDHLAYACIPRSNFLFADFLQAECVVLHSQQVLCPENLSRKVRTEFMNRSDNLLSINHKI